MRSLAAPSEKKSTAATGDGKEGAIIGALLGASIASDIERDAAMKKGGTQTEVQCSTVYSEVQVRKPWGYKVGYEFGGHLFEYTVKSRPRNTIAIRVYAVPLDANY